MILTDTSVESQFRKLRPREESIFQLHTATQGAACEFPDSQNQCCHARLSRPLPRPGSPLLFFLPPDSRRKQLCSSFSLVLRPRLRNNKKGMIFVPSQTQKHLWVLISFGGYGVGSLQLLEQTSAPLLQVKPILSLLLPQMHPPARIPSLSSFLPQVLYSYQPLLF